MLASWAAAGAAAVGARRIVAERVAAMHRRRAFMHTLHAWSDAKVGLFTS